MTHQPMHLGTARLTGKPEDEQGSGSALTPGSGALSPAATPVAEGGPMSMEHIQELREKILAALCTCYDPEIPVNIYELGLIYQIDVSPEGGVTIRMTLTSPACPVAGILPGEVQRKVQAIPGVSGVTVELVWDPPWDKGRMSDAARLQLGIDDY